MSTNRQPDSKPTVRENGIFRGALKVLFITGFAAVAMNARREMAMSKVLSKPFHLRELVDNVERILAA